MNQVLSSPEFFSSTLQEAFETQDDRMVFELMRYAFDTKNATYMTWVWEGAKMHNELPSLRSTWIALMTQVVEKVPPPTNPFFDQALSLLTQDLMMLEPNSWVFARRGSTIFTPLVKALSEHHPPTLIHWLTQPCFVKHQVIRLDHHLIQVLEDQPQTFQALLDHFHQTLMPSEVDAMMWCENQRLQLDPRRDAHPHALWKRLVADQSRSWWENLFIHSTSTNSKNAFDSQAWNAYCERQHLWLSIPEPSLNHAPSPKPKKL